MSSNKEDRGTPFKVTATNATAATASNAGVIGSTHYITDITVSSDKATSICTVKQGTTAIWQFQLGATAHSRVFETPLAGVPGALVSVEVDGTAACYANIAGFTL